MRDQNLKKFIFVAVMLNKYIYIYMICYMLSNDLVVDEKKKKEAEQILADTTSDTKKKKKKEV